MTIFFHNRTTDCYSRREAGVGEVLDHVNGSLVPEQGLPEFLAAVQRHGMKLSVVKRVYEHYPEMRSGGKLLLLRKQPAWVIALISSHLRSVPDGVKLSDLRDFIEEQYGIVYLKSGSLSPHLLLTSYLIREAFYLVDGWLDRFGYGYRLHATCLDASPAKAQAKPAERKHHARQAGRR